MENWLGIDESLLEEYDNIEVPEFKQIESGVYKVKIDKAYLTTSSGGATMFNIDMVEIADDNPIGGRHIFWNTAVRSGDAKGNKATYTRDGKEYPLPGTIIVKHLFNAVGVPLNVKPKPVKVEHYGNVVDAKAFAELEGREVCVAIQQYEDEYNGEMKIKIDVKDFFKCDDAEKMEKWKKYLDRNPLRKSRKKKEVQQTDEDIEI